MARISLRKPLVAAALALGFALGVAAGGRLGVGPAHAAFVVDPTTGAPLSFEWDDGLGPVDRIGGIATSDFTISSPTGLRVNILLNDAFFPGDEFSLALNGVTLTPTSTGTDLSGYFFARYENLVVASGLQTFTISVTALAPGVSPSQAFGGVDIVSTVPEPASLLLVAAGLTAFGLVGRRTRRRRNA
jgi:hypothetical protein